MRLLAWVVGAPNVTVVVFVQPHDTIAELLDQVTQRLAGYNEPTEFIAFSAKQSDQWLKANTPDYFALIKRDPVAVSRYLTPTARLEPTKTVADCFGHSVSPNTAHILLEWSSASWSQHIASCHNLSDQMVKRNPLLKLAMTFAAKLTDRGTISEEATYPWPFISRCIPPAVCKLWASAGTSSMDKKIN